MLPHENGLHLLLLNRTMRWLWLIGMQGTVVFFSVIFGFDFPIFLLGLLLFFLCLQWEILGLSVFVLLHIFIIRSTIEITPGELVFEIFSILFLLTWFIRHVVIDREKQLLNAADWLFFLFFCVAILSILTALINRNNLLLWAREFAVNLVFLFYFPIKGIVKSKRHILFVMLPFIVLAIFVATMDIINYRELILQASYAWEIQSSRRVEDEPLFLGMIIMALSFLLYIDKIRWKLVSACLLLFFACALAITFSRGYWMGVAIGTFTLFLISAKSKRGTLILYCSIVILGLAFMFTLFFDKYANIITQQVIARFFTLENVSTDYSVRSRLAEYSAVFVEALRSPIVGKGFGSTFSFYDIASGHQVERSFTHNSYFFLFFKLGILGLGLFVSYYFFMIRQAWLNFQYTSGWLKSVNAGTFCIFIALAVVSLSSPQVIHKNSVLIFALCSGVTAVIPKLNSKSQINEKAPPNSTDA